MAAKNPFNMMHTGPRVPIKNLTEGITCTLCKGYFIDATTIIECLHTFCRSCIVKYLEKNKYCPVCDVQVHKTKPLLNLRADTTIQNIVYKLVPRLYHNEMKRREVYYDTHPEAKPTIFELNVEELYQNFLTPEETLCLTLSYNGCEGSSRYFRCPSAVNVVHIKRLIRAKYELTQHHRVEVMYNQDCLSPDLSLMDVAYIYSWKRNTPLELTYKIYECRSKKPKLDPSEPLEIAQFNNADTSNNNNWKEVQLRISESGEMSITGIQDANNLLTLLDNESFKQEVVIGPVVLNDSKHLKLEEKKTEEIKPVEEKPKTPKKPRTPSSKSKKLSIKKESTTQNNVSPAKKELPGLKLLIPKPKPDVPKTVSTTSTSVTSTITPKTATSSSTTISSHNTPTTSSTVQNKVNCSVNYSVADTINRVLSNSQLTVTVDPKTIENSTSIANIPSTLSLGAVKTVFSTINSTKCSTKLEESSAIPGKRKNEDQMCEVPLKIPKPTILNHSLSLINNLSKNHPLKKHSKLNRNGEHQKSLEIVSSAASLGNCLSPVGKIPSVVENSSGGNPIILNQNVAQQNQGPIAKQPMVSVPSYIPKSVYSPVVSAPKPAAVSQSALTISRSNPASNEEGKVGTNVAKTTEVSLSATVPSQSLPQVSLSLPSTAQSLPAYTYNSISTAHSTPFLLNSAISTALKHPGITTFSTHLTPSTGYNHSPYLPPPPPQQIRPPVAPPTTLPHQPGRMSAPPATTASQPIKTKPTTPLGYKTLRDPPKSWNAQIAKANLNVQKAANSQAMAQAGGNSGVGSINVPPGGRFSDLKSVRPAKFFKQRNMPRYLGNPASGVKPMFPVQSSPDKSKEPSATSTTTATTTTPTATTAKTEKSEIKKHSIVKIDPKTLKPISEKAPETTSLSNISTSVSSGTSAIQQQSSHQHQNSQEQRVPPTPSKDLRINTSSVSIFNPLKLQQNSPKGDRKSPKSPHSPKPKSTTTSTSSASSSTTVTTSSSPATSVPAVSVPSSPTSLKRDAPQKQPNLTFTPPNPFVPNMAAPALSPNQFLFPTGGPPGFPTYDPRFMAAYHSLWYSQRLAAAGFHGAFPGAAGLGLGNLGLPGAPHQQRSPVSPKHSTLPKSSPTASRNNITSNNTTSKSPGSKKPKENTNKSLETALEKLTQNKVKELSNKSEKSSPANKDINLPSTTNLNTSKLGSNSAILPPIVPNVDSVEKKPVEKVPVLNNIADRHNVKRDVNKHENNTNSSRETCVESKKGKEVEKTTKTSESLVNNLKESSKQPTEKIVSSQSTKSNDSPNTPPKDIPTTTIVSSLTTKPSESESVVSTNNQIISHPVCTKNKKDSDDVPQPVGAENNKAAASDIKCDLTKKPDNLGEKETATETSQKSENKAEAKKDSAIDVSVSEMVAVKGSEQNEVKKKEENIVEEKK